MTRRDDFVVMIIVRRITHLFLYLFCTRFSRGRVDGADAYASNEHAAI